MEIQVSWLDLMRTLLVHQDWTTSSLHIMVLLYQYLALTALTQVENTGNFINIAALFDHEECGS